MFTRIAGRYDLMNSLMTGGRHHAWRRYAAAAAAGAPAGPVLDLATGTGDLALAVRAASPGRPVIGADFSRGDAAPRRSASCAARAERACRCWPPTRWRCPFADSAFACVTSAFLLRNLGDLAAGPRGDAPGDDARAGCVVALEIIRAAVPGWGALFGLYFHRVVPLDRRRRRGRPPGLHLPAGLGRPLPHRRELALAMQRAGLRDVRYRTLGLGTIALHTGTV